ncbi:MAG: GNAT family N-acetyltransferase [Solibacillus sp.]|jgi:ribosomal protein S18 acetylase RimI-like enzyme|uniref:GNAT family N-acetyltransferase n=1 Tax=Solibacillus sp. TaxID=1909654 RepID=UPI00331525C4
MSILIRQAQITEASAIAPLIYDAIGDIANNLTGEHELQKILASLEQLIKQTTNRHSYLNTYVAVQEEYVLGIVVLYDGKQGKVLDRQLEAQLATKMIHVSLDIEAHDDEYYIDTVCVSEKARGRGIGTKLLQFAEQQGKELGYDKISLNVELEKVDARRLYERMGYVVTEPWTIIEEPFHHMVKLLH